MKRRDILSGGLIGAASLILPGRALADPLVDAFDKTFTAPVPPPTSGAPAGAAAGLPGAAAPATASPAAASATGPISVPAAPIGNPAYERRVLEIAKREVERAGARVWRRDLAGIADFARSSGLPRFHFANLENGSVRSFLVAHGRGSDPEHDGYLKTFSNVPGSEATSRGGYLTCEWYKGKYGTSIRLVGLDYDNSTALERAIVMHPAKYVDANMAATWGKIGRSEGCFAMSQADFNEALWHLSGGRLLYADRILMT